MKKLNLVGAIVLFMAVAGLMLFSHMAGRAQAADSLAKSARIYELRVYTTNDGKLEALHSRFRDHTNGLFVKHGMTLIGYWTPTDGDEAANTLIYILGHESREAAKESWAAFGADPDWRKAYADSIADGRLLAKAPDSTFMSPTDYSPLR